MRGYRITTFHETTECQALVTDKELFMKRSGIRFAPLAAFLVMAAIAAGTVMFLLPVSGQASTISPAVLALFPRDLGEFAYADLKAARQFTWYTQLHEQMLPARFRDFEKFLTDAGVDPNTQVEEVAWGFVEANGDQGEQFLGVAQGQFNPSSSEDRMKAKKVPTVTVGGFHLYSFGAGTGANDTLFFFIDSNTAAFGARKALEQLIDVRAGNGDNLLHNTSIGPLVNEANSEGLVWAVLDQKYTQLAIKQMLPGTDQFPQAGKILGRMKAMIINVKARSGIDAVFHAECASTDDANTLAAALQAGVLYRKYQANQTNPDLAKALDGVHITPSGDRLTVESPISDDQLQALLRNGTFTVKM
jgi:hypothetical protein